MQIEIIARLIIAGVCGALIGLERRSRSKEAGLRTHFLAVSQHKWSVVSVYGSRYHTCLTAVCARPNDHGWIVVDGGPRIG